jgi:hypothetical protein
MAIPLTGPISLGDLKNDTAASTASFSDPRIRRRYVSADGLKYGDQLPANTQMSLGDFRGSVLTLEKDFSNTLQANASIGTQTQQLVRDDASNYGSSSIDEFRVNPQYRRLQVRQEQAYARDVSVGMFSVAYINPSLLPARLSLTAYVVSQDTAQRTIVGVNGWASNYFQGTTSQPVWMDDLDSGLIQVTFDMPAGLPYITVGLMQVVRGSLAYEECDWVGDNGTYTNAKFKVMNLRFA